MHELSVCQSMMQQLEAIAAQENARKITSITLRIGPLSGIEPELLAQAFPVAAAGSLAEQAKLTIETQPVRVYCPRCDAEYGVPGNRLVCPQCGDLQTRIVSGDELLLASLELLRD